MTSESLERRLGEALKAEAQRAPLRTPLWRDRTSVLIVEDDAEMRRLLTDLLGAEGYTVQAVASSTEALAAPDADLVVIDIVLGKEDGRVLLHELRLISDVPVVFLTGRGHEIDRIAGLKMGADDYVVKPFSAGELSARIDAVMRRARPKNGGSTETRSRQGLEFGPLRIDPVAREVEVDRELIELTAKEFDLISFLASSPRQVFSRQQLLEHVWSSSSEWQDEATVTEHVRRVRKKVEADPQRPQWIMTVRGVGYRFEPVSPPGSPGQTESTQGMGSGAAAIRTAAARVLVVADDPQLRRLLARILGRDGYEVQAAGDSAAAIASLARHEPDLVLFDTALGNERARDLLRELRRLNDVPVLFLTAPDHEIDKIAGLNMGLDDCIVKPFRPSELSARVESVLRRGRRAPDRELGPRN